MIEDDGKKTPPEDKPKETPKPKAEEKSKPEEKPKEEKKEDLDAEWKKSSEAIAEKLFGKKPKKDEKKDEKKEETKVESVKEETKPEEKKSRRRQPIDETALAERTAAAAAEAATKAATAAVAKISGASSQDKPAAKTSDQDLTDEEKRQFDVYHELESLYPSKYKNLTKTYIKSLGEIQSYIKDWAKDNPGKPFNADDEDHNDFFQRVEPPVDDDDYIDAKAAIRAREFTQKAIEPVQEKMKEYERERARTVLEPFIREKQLEAVHSMLENFDPAVAAEIRKPNGLTTLQEKDPITADILGRTANILGDMSAEVIRLHDPAVGVPYDPRNNLHKEIADFIVSQEHRISKLPSNDRARDGKMFISRLQYQQLPQEDKGRYWFLNQNDILFMLAQKYGEQAKKIRDDQVSQFNKTAERLGYKKGETSQVTTSKNGDQSNSTRKPAPTTVSPESTSGAKLNTSPESPIKKEDDFGSAIVAKLFPHRV